MTVLRLAIFSLLLGAPLLAADPISSSDFVFFENHIRPLLIEHCYECHCPDKQKGGLRLDSRPATLRGGDSGPALVPGNPEESLLLKAVSHSDPDLQMPPKTPLRAEEVQRLAEWITRGAPDPREESSPNSSTATKATDGTNHWAYLPVTAHKPPVTNSSWPRTDIDQFIFARMRSENLSPGPDADKATLQRRLYYDLIGLPPSPAQVDSFAKDSSPAAYERLVDELLASPHFGERWGRHWLDIARFAESVTLRGLVFKHAWRYRDYVIDSYNRDLPFNRFVTEQIAGDLLPAPSVEGIDERHRALAATTYLVLGNFNYEEQDKDQLRMDIVDEQLDTIGKGLLGQTLSCARCHDHKFDPIPTRDYYALAGILRNVKSAEHANVSTWLDLPLPLPSAEEKKLQEHEREIAELNRAIRKQTERIAQYSQSQAHSISLETLPGIVIDDGNAKLVGEWQPSTFNKPFLGSGYVHDRNEGKGAKTITFLPELKSAGKYEVRFAYTHGENRAAKVPITILHSAGETTVTVNERQAPPINGHFVSLGQFHFEQGNQGYVIVSTTDSEGHVIADAVQFLPIDAQEAAPPPSDPKLALLNKELDQRKRDLKKLIDGGPKRPMVMSVKEETNIADTSIHIRGSVHRLGERIPRGFLAVASRRMNDLPNFDAQESGRRQLAQWITHPGNPLTARVYVNRVWAWLLGEGLVRSTDNFGTTGDHPSHPELLDYLAHRFIANGWSTKKLVRDIVLSRTYQLSSARLNQQDPENRFYSRAHRRRLDAEALRDSILAVSGRLDLTAGGSTFKPDTAADFAYADQTTRRSVYVPAFRNALPQIFQLFDFADTSVVTGQRHSSIISPQALYFLNHPFILENAHSAAQRNAGASPSEQITRAYRQTLGRSPTASELTLALDHLDSENKSALAELYQSLFASPSFRFLD